MWVTVSNKLQDLLNYSFFTAWQPLMIAERLMAQHALGWWGRRWTRGDCGGTSACVTLWGSYAMLGYMEAIALKWQQRGSFCPLLFDQTASHRLPQIVWTSAAMTTGAFSPISILRRLKHMWATTLTEFTVALSKKAYVWIIEAAPSCCLTISAMQNTSGFSITLKDTWPQGRPIEPKISRWAEAPFPQHSVWLKYLRHVIILMYLCISMHSYIFSQDLLQEEVDWWTDDPPPPSFPLLWCRHPQQMIAPGWKQPRPFVSLSLQMLVALLFSNEPQKDLCLCLGRHTLASWPVMWPDNVKNNVFHQSCGTIFN